MAIEKSESKYYDVMWSVGFTHSVLLAAAAGTALRFTERVVSGRVTGLR